jgi:hypothetical protein
MDLWERQREPLVDQYAKGRSSFVPCLLPEQAVRLSAADTMGILRRRLEEKLDVALQRSEPGDSPLQYHDPLAGPVAGKPDGGWLKSSNVVGVNVRTVGSFWNVVKYALTLPGAQDAIHLLPIWEPGVVGSLYGMSSWEINDEFYSQELARACPELDSVDRQLKAVINLLHAMGKAVGMDMIPHTDRFSEIVLASPQYFEWLQREGTEIVDHTENLHERVQACVMRFLAVEGAAVPDVDYATAPEGFFSGDFPEEKRLIVLFGLPSDRSGRAGRRNRLVRYLHAYGFETVPATMAPPFRGLKIDTETEYVDSQGNRWYDFSIVEPQAMSRVFNPLTRYKLYGRLDDNADWAIDFDNPRREVWHYVREKYATVQQRYGFDFMRGDMSHVQMRPEGVPQVIDEYYDILRAVKNHIRVNKGVHHFAYFAETFLAARNIMVYGDEVDHLEASDADVTLGDLQSTCVGSPEFLQRLRQYYDLAETRSFAPSFTVITGDKDDPRFDGFYLRGNALRLFMALFLTDMPSYMALGFETRDLHHKPAPNEHYSKLYVFQERIGPKATGGPFVWGGNGALFRSISRLRSYADAVYSQIRGCPTRWLIHPDATAAQKHIAWTQRRSRPDYVFVANTDTEHVVLNFNIPCIPDLGPGTALELDFSTAEVDSGRDLRLESAAWGFKVTELAAAEGRVYRIRYRTCIEPR